MSELKLSFHEIKELMSHAASLNLGEVTVEDGDFKLTIAGRPAAQVVAASAAVPAVQPVAQSVGTSVEVNVTKAEEKQPEGNIVRSPIVGTFYASAAPDKPPFVTVGSKVKKGDVLFVIESMKLMNEIQSDYDGEVAEILVENAQGVEYNQPILTIK